MYVCMYVYIYTHTLNILDYTRLYYNILLYYTYDIT